MKASGDIQSREQFARSLCRLFEDASANGVDTTGAYVVTDHDGCEFELVVTPVHR